MYYDHREWPYPVEQRPAQLLNLALILEVKSKKMWTFEKFLNQFTSILCQANDNWALCDHQEYTSSYARRKWGKKQMINYKNKLCG